MTRPRKPAPGEPPDRPEICVRFGAAVKARREALGMTQEECAERTQIHRTYLSDIERGMRNPALVNIGRLAEALSLTLTELIQLVESPWKSE